MSDWTFSQFFFGLAIAAAGFILVWKADWILRNFGGVPFAEKYLSSEGGSRLFYKFIGILIMIIGIMYATDLLEPLGTYLVKKFFSPGRE